MVNLTLARGLRSRTLNEYRRMADQYDDVTRDALRAAVQGKWTAKRAKALITHLDGRGSKRAFATVIVNTGASSTVVHFAPRVEGESLFVDIVRIEVPSRHKPLPPRAVVAMQLAPHAVERLFQRLRTVEAEEVREELRTGLFLALPLRVAAETLGLKQVPVPTEHGLLLCDGNGRNPLMARTWLRNNEPGRGAQTISLRWARVAAVIRGVATAFEAQNPDEDGVRMPMAAIGFAELIEELVPLLVSALEPFPWLKDPYVAADDDPNEVWGQARAQQAGAR